MKKLIQGIIIVALFATCNNKASAPLQTDLVVLNLGNKMHVYTDELPVTSAAATKRQVLSETESSHPVSSSLTYIPEDIVNLPQQEVPLAKPVQVKEAEATSETTATTISANTPNDTDAVTPNSDKQDTVSTTTIAPVIAEKEKKGWSNATKGAVIGGVGGAIGGAILSRKKAQGAIIGAVIGAGGGYIFGKTKDNKLEADSNQFTRYK